MNLRTFALAGLLLAAMISFGGATEGSPALTEDVAASCIYDPTDGGCVQSPVPIPCRPFEGEKYLGNLDVCLY